MSKSIIAGILKNIELSPAAEQEILAGVPTSSQVKAELCDRVWSIVPAALKTLTGGDRRVLFEHDGKRELISLRAQADDVLFHLINLYHGPTIQANLLAARNDFYTLCTSVTEGVALSNMKAVSDPEMCDGIVFAADGRAVYWKQAAPGFVVDAVQGRGTPQVKTTVAEFVLKPGILAGVDQVSLQLLADQTGTTVPQLKRMDRSKDHKVLAELTLRVIAVLDVFKLENEREATFEELKASVEAIGVPRGTVEGAAESYTVGEYDGEGSGDWAVLCQPSNTWVFPKGEEVKASKEDAEAKAAELRKGIKAAAVAKEFDPKGEQATPPTDKDHRSELLDDKKRPAVIIDKEPSKDPLKPKETLYSAKEVSLKDLQKPDAGFALAVWCVTMEEAKAKAKDLERRRADYMPLPDHWVPPAPEADGEGIKKVKDEVNGDDRLVVKEIKDPSSPQALEPADVKNLDTTREQLDKVRRGEVMAGTYADDDESWDTGEVSLWLANDEDLYRAVRRAYDGASLEKIVKPMMADNPDIQVDWAAVNWDSIYKEFADEDVVAWLKAAARRHLAGRKIKASTDESPDSEDVDGTDVRVYDNGGETFDRYTIVIENPVTLEQSWLGSSQDPFFPSGFGQHLGDEASGMQEGEHLGRRIKFAELPEKVQQFVRQDTKVMAPTPDQLKQLEGRLRAGIENDEASPAYHFEEFGTEVWETLKRDVSLNMAVSSAEKKGLDEYYVGFGNSGQEAALNAVEEAENDGQTVPAEAKAEAKGMPKAKLSKAEIDDDLSVITVLFMKAKPGVTAAPKKKGAPKGKPKPKAKAKDEPKPGSESMSGVPSKDPKATPGPGQGEMDESRTGPSDTLQESGDTMGFMKLARTNLAKALGVGEDELEEKEPRFPYDDPKMEGEVAYFEHGDEEYTVFADDDAEDFAKEMVRNDFGEHGEGFDIYNPEFLMSHVDEAALKDYMEEVFREFADQDWTEYGSKEATGTEEEWKTEYVQERLGQDSGQTWWTDNVGADDFKKIVKDQGFFDVEAIVQDAVDVDGPGRFLSAYDNELHDIGDGLVYARWN